MFAVVEMVESPCSYVVGNDDFFLRFSWDVSGGVTFGDQQSVRSDCCSPDKESDFVVHVSGFGGWSLAGYEVTFGSSAGIASFLC